MLENRIKQALDKRATDHKLRRLSGTLQGIDFCSNDYLSLASSKQVHRKLQGYLENENMLGASGSRLISGDRDEWLDIERMIAQYHDADAALVFGSGYQANVGLITALALRAEVIFFDELVHASLREGIRLAGIPVFAFPHNDKDALAQHLAQSEGQALVVVESIYSMDGDEAPLAAIAECCDTHQAALIVDEAHALGVFGPKGSGIVTEQGLTNLVFARVATFGKGLGAHGAAVLGSSALMQYLCNYARTFIYTTGPAAHTWWHIKAAYEVLAKSSYEQESLQQNIKFFKANIPASIQSYFIPARGPIQSMLLSGNEKVMRIARELQEAGFAIIGIRHPSVPKGQERLRICLHAHNTVSEIKGLLHMLESLVIEN